MSTQPQINTSIYPAIRISVFAAPKTQKIRGPRFTSKSSEKPYISSIFTLSIMYFSQQNHALHMHRHREHIDRCQAFCFISVCGQILQISCQCRGIAADVDDSFRLHFDDGLKQGFIAAFSWRIDYDHIGFDVFGFVFVRQDFFCFANIKLCILDAVSSGIVFRICDGRRHNLYAVNLFCFLCKEQRDGSDAAVEIPYGLFTGQSCVFQGFSVKLFGLYRVDLIERQRGNAVFDISDISSI